MNKTNLRENVMGNLLAYIRIYDKAYQCRNKQVDQWNRIENTGTNAAKMEI